MAVQVRVSVQDQLPGRQSNEGSDSER
jgi:hypothetical protein